jgi:hypothetical protein
MAMVQGISETEGRRLTPSGNCDIGEFLSQMSPDPAEPLIVCVNSGESLKRHEQHLGGQLWIQGSRQMTATNIPFEGMSNDATSAIFLIHLLGLAPAGYLTASDNGA